MTKKEFDIQVALGNFATHYDEMEAIKYGLVACKFCKCHQPGHITPWGYSINHGKTDQTFFIHCKICKGFWTGTRSEMNEHDHD